MACCTLGTVFQIITIVAALFAVVMAIVYFFVRFNDASDLFINVIFIFLLPFMKYFGFILTFWGKAFVFIFLGLLNFDPNSGYGITTAVVMWLAGICQIVFYFVNSRLVSPPLLQSSPEFSTSNNDFF